MTANWPIPVAVLALRRIAACVTFGAISLSSSSHFPHRLYSNIIKPVALAPGCDRDSTKPDPTGSGALTNTMGNGASDFQRHLCGGAARGDKHVRSKRNEF